MFGTNLGLHVIKYPSGKFGFVGRVPQELAYISSNPDYFKTAQLCGPGFASKAAEREGGTFKARTWETAEAAKQEATALGFPVK